MPRVQGYGPASERHGAPSTTVSGCRHRRGRACVEAHTHDGRARWDTRCAIGPRSLSTPRLLLLRSSLLWLLWLTVVVVVVDFVVDVVIVVVVVVVVAVFT